MAFKDIAGNVRIKRILKLAFERGRVPHSVIFAGPEGVGRREMALTLAKTLNCRTLTADSCDECPSCRAIDAGTHPDVMVLTVEVQKLKVEQTELVKQMAYLRPMTGKCRVFIIDDAKDMTPEASNSLLKVLEEPPAFAHIILLTDSPPSSSRPSAPAARRWPSRRSAREEIEEILLERDFSPEQARILALLVGGTSSGPSISNWDEVQSLKEEAWGLLRGPRVDRPLGPFPGEFGALPKAVQEEFGRTLELSSSFVRDILLLRLGGDPAVPPEPGLRTAAPRRRASWSRRRVLGVLASSISCSAQPRAT